MSFHVIHNAAAHMQTFLLLWEAEGTDATKWKQNIKDGDFCFSLRDTTGKQEITLFDPQNQNQACSFILEI